MITKILSGGIVFLMLAFGVFYWNHQRVVRNFNSQIETLQGEKLALEIQAKAQQATIEYLEKTKQVKARVNREKKGIKEVVESGDLGGIRDLYGKYRVQPADQGSPAPGGTRGDPGH
jgi:hypothetical protein